MHQKGCEYAKLLGLKHEAYLEYDEWFNAGERQSRRAF